MCTCEGIPCPVIDAEFLADMKGLSWPSREESRLKRSLEEVE